MTNAEYEATVLYDGRQLLRTTYPADPERNIRASVGWVEVRFGHTHSVRYPAGGEPSIAEVIVRLDDWWRDGYPAMKARQR